jgi:tetratricopeptide (TPR) repeat protein
MDDVQADANAGREKGLTADLMRRVPGTAGLLRYQGAVFFLFTALCCFFLYSESLNGPFLYDDDINITENRNLRISSLDFESLLRAGFQMQVKNRPLAYISFALNYYFHGYDVLGYRFVNVLIHIATGLVFYYLALLTPSLQPGAVDEGRRKAVSFLSSLIWLVHPLQTQTVNYIVQRMTGLEALFFMLSLLLYVVARTRDGRAAKTAAFAGSLVCGLCAMATKEIAATLPLFIFLYEWFFFRDLKADWLKKTAPLVLAFYAAAGGALLLFGIHVQERLQDYGYGVRGFSPLQRVMTESRVVMTYLGLLVFPHPSRLTMIYDYQLSRSLFHPITTLLSSLSIVAMGALAVLAAKKERMLSFSILWYLGNLAIESSIIPLDIIYEHRVYLPSMFPILAAVTAAFRLSRRAGVPVAICCLVAAVCSTWTYRRNAVWTDELVFWQDNAKKSPDNPKVLVNLGIALSDRGRLNDAEGVIERALKADDRNPLAYYNLGKVQERKGDLEEAFVNYSKAVTLDPKRVDALNNMGVILIKKGFLEKSLELFRRAIEIDPDYAAAKNNIRTVEKKMQRE